MKKGGWISPATAATCIHYVVFNLKDEFEPKLYFSGRPHAEILSKLRRAIREARSTEVRVVDCIEEFGSEFCLEPLSNAGILLKCNVPALTPWSSYGVPSRITKGVMCRNGKATGVKELRHLLAPTAPAAQIRVTSLIRITRFSVIQVIKSVKNWANGQTTEDSRNTLKLPPSNKFTPYASLAAGEVLPGAKRKRINITKSESVPEGNVRHSSFGFAVPGLLLPVTRFLNITPTAVVDALGKALSGRKRDALRKAALD